MAWLPTVQLSQWVHFPSPSTAKHVLYGIFIGFMLSAASTTIALDYQERKRKHAERQFKARPIEIRSDEIAGGVTGLIGLSAHNNIRI